MKSTTQRIATSVCMILWVFVSFGFMSPVFGEPADSDGQTYEDYRAQGVNYFKRGLFQQARVQFEAARKTKDGRMDPLTNLYLARTYQEQQDLKRSFSVAEWANRIAEPGTPLAGEIEDFLDGLMGSFAPVEFHSGDVPATTIHLQANQRFLNQTKSGAYEAVRTRLRSKEVRMPATEYLPFGTYTANGVTFTVSGRQVSTIIVDIPPHGGRQDAAAGSSGRVWLYVGTGLAIAAASLGTWLYLQDDETPAPLTPYQIEILN